MAYKSFSVTPLSAKDLKGEEVDLSKVVSLLIKDVKTLSEAGGVSDSRRFFKH